MSSSMFHCVHSHQRTRIQAFRTLKAWTYQNQGSTLISAQHQAYLGLRFWRTRQQNTKVFSGEASQQKRVGTIEIRCLIKMVPSLILVHANGLRKESEKCPQNDVPHIYNAAMRPVCADNKQSVCNNRWGLVWTCLHTNHWIHIRRSRNWVRSMSKYAKCWRSWHKWHSLCRHLLRPRWSTTIQSSQNYCRLGLLTSWLVGVNKYWFIFAGFPHVHAASRFDQLSLDCCKHIQLYLDNQVLANEWVAHRNQISDSPIVFDQLSNNWTRKHLVSCRSLLS